jgi:hypothetical protein
MPGTSKPKRTQARYDPNRSPHQAPEMIELVDPAWILKALGAMLLLCLLFAYVTLCMLFSAKQWQLALYPSRTLASTPASLGMSFSDVHFGVDNSGEPQLDGWWIPAADAGRTVLMLHGAHGNMADDLPAAETFHALGLNVLLFDYRGFGRSGGQHPAMLPMQQDARDARSYLTDIRKVGAADLVVYGQGLGASIAVNLCAATGCTAMILDAPDGDLYARAAADPRSRIVPSSLLFHERFPLAAPLHALMTPKLIITYSASVPQALQSAADPKMLVELPRGDATLYSQAIRRFLSEYK